MSVSGAGDPLSAIPQTPSTPPASGSAATHSPTPNDTSTIASLSPEESVSLWKSIVACITNLFTSFFQKIREYFNAPSIASTPTSGPLIVQQSKEVELFGHIAELIPTPNCYPTVILAGIEFKTPSFLGLFGGKTEFCHMLDLQFNSEEEFGRTINQQKLVFSQSIQNYLQQHSVSDFNIFFFKASPSACTSKEDEPFYDAHLLSYSVSNGTVSSSKHICECQVTETTREGLEIMLYQANLQPDMARMLVPNIDTITNRLVTSSPIAITA